MPKLIILAVWVLSVAAWVVPWTGWFGTIIGWAAPFMAVAHVVEFVVFREVFAKSGGSLVSHFFQTFIFDVFHIDPLKEALGEAPAES